MSNPEYDAACEKGVPAQPREEWTRVQGVVVRGHRVASGACGDPRFPGGTIALQKPLFHKLGLDLERFQSATINLSIAPLEFQLRAPCHRFNGLCWTEHAPAEDFSFVECRVLLANEQTLEGVVYYPHPETKPEHFQAPGTLEIMTYPIPNLCYGDRLTVELDPLQIELFERGASKGES